MDKLVPLEIPPGLLNTGTAYQSKGRWHAGNFVRFFNKTIQPIGGWTARSLSGATISGVPRAAVSYMRQTGSASVPVMVIGTTRGLYAIVSNVKYDITPTAISSTVADRSWLLDVFGDFLIATEVTSTAAGRGYYWAGNTGTPAADVARFNNGIGPANTYGLLGTSDRYMLALGGPYSNTGQLLVSGIPNPRVVMWATREAGFALADWEPLATNTAGSQELATLGTLRAALRARGNTLIWTTTDLWTMTYIGGQFVHSFAQAGNNCGIISAHAAVVTDAAAFWMGPNDFFTYDGFVKPLPSDVHDYVFGSFNHTYDHLVWAHENPAYGEITWYYPHAAQTEVTRYVTFSYREGHWTTGTLARTAGIPSQPGVSNNPVLLNASASVFDHETGTSRNSEGTPSLESGPIELGEGDNLMQIQSILPDDSTVGDVNMTLYTAPNPDTTETANGPYTLTSRTTLRVKARQVRVKLTEAVASAWRVGIIRLGVVKSSRR